jgi:hypothetical protein
MRDAAENGSTSGPTSWTLSQRLGVARFEFQVMLLEESPEMDLAMMARMHKALYGSADEFEAALRDACREG